MGANVRKDDRYEGVFWVTLEDGSKRLATKNLAPGVTVYGEKLVKTERTSIEHGTLTEANLQPPYSRNINALPLKKNISVLYLGSASGTTASHVSDIVEEGGRVFCVEFAQRSMRELIDSLCQHRSNVYPILSDARMPEKYKTLVTPVDVIYSDVAQPQQGKILADNCRRFSQTERLRIGGNQIQKC